jgi:hypothetical protein
MILNWFYYLLIEEEQNLEQVIEPLELPFHHPRLNVNNSRPLAHQTKLKLQRSHPDEICKNNP